MAVLIAVAGALACSVAACAVLNYLESEEQRLLEADPD